MKNRIFKDKTLLLREGLDYDLNITRIISIPGDNEYFIGRDPNGLRHLIPVAHYRHYGINSGSTVKCRLDRINCQGRFYFEPEHPFYKRGKTYRFEFSGFEPAGGAVGMFRALVKDRAGREQLTEQFPIPPVPPCNITSLLCRVTAVRKGKMLIEVNDPLISQHPAQGHP
jgi:hypothetical protein